MTNHKSIETKNRIYDTYENSTLENKTLQNATFLIGELLGIEESGRYQRENCHLVLMRTVRNTNKPNYLWVLLKDTPEMVALVKRQATVYIEGYLAVSPSFNDRAVSHTFIVPTHFDVLDTPTELPRVSDFQLNYTVNNRVILEGCVIGNPWKETIPPSNKTVTRFPMLITVNNQKRKIYCTIWEDMNTVGDITKGMELRILGSYTMLKKERNLTIQDGYVTNCVKNKLDSYVVVVQQVDHLNSNPNVELHSNA